MFVADLLATQDAERARQQQDRSTQPASLRGCGGGGGSVVSGSSASGTDSIGRDVSQQPNAGKQQDSWPLGSLQDSGMARTRHNAQRDSLLVRDVGGSSAERRRLMAAATVPLHNVTNAFYGAFLAELHKGTYQVLVTEGFERCRQQLPWWQDYQTGGLTISTKTSS